MDIKNAFLNALLSQPKLASSRKPEDFLGTFISPPPSIGTFFLYFMAGGKVSATFPWTFDMEDIDCSILLYTKSGSGKLQTDFGSYALSPSSLLYLNCRQHFRFDITGDPWEYQIYFVGGSLLSHYNELLPSNKPVLIPVVSYSNLMADLERLPFQASDMTPAEELSVSDLINHIITDCLITSMQETEPKQIPAYIKDMKELFDSNYQDQHSLDELEDRIGISKYRLCREFGAAYDLSPLQYLNKRRIEVAAYLLQTTGHRVHEIGSMVGIDNTNHFIHLFKKFLQCTPSEYKQRMTR